MEHLSYRELGACLIALDAQLGTHPASWTMAARQLREKLVRMQLDCCSWCGAAVCKCHPEDVEERAAAGDDGDDERSCNRCGDELDGNSWSDVCGPCADRVGP